MGRGRGMGMMAPGMGMMGPGMEMGGMMPMGPMMMPGVWHDVEVCGMMMPMRPMMMPGVCAQSS